VYPLHAGGASTSGSASEAIARSGYLMGGALHGSVFRDFSIALVSPVLVPARYHFISTTQ